MLTDYLTDKTRQSSPLAIEFIVNASTLIVNFSIWHTIWHLIRYAQRLYWVDTILWLFIAGLPAIPGIIIREFFNTLTAKSAGLLSVWEWIALFLAIGLAHIVAIFTGRITKTQHRFIMSALVRHNLLRGLMKRPGAEPLMDNKEGNSSVSPGAIISFFGMMLNSLKITWWGQMKLLAREYLLLVR